MKLWDCPSLDYTGMETRYLSPSHLIIIIQKAFWYKRDDWLISNLQALGKKFCDSRVLRTYIPWNLHSITIYHIPSSLRSGSGSQGFVGLELCELALDSWNAWLYLLSGIVRLHGCVEHSWHFESFWIMFESIIQAM